MAILEKFEKQSGDTQDFDISFVEWLAALGDTAATHTTLADTGITKISSSLSGGIVKVWLSGGVHGTKYKITAIVTTASVPTARVKEAEIIVTVKDY